MTAFSTTSPTATTDHNIEHANREAQKVLDKKRKKRRKLSSSNDLKHIKVEGLD